MHSTQCAVCSEQCAVHSVQWTVYVVQCTLCSVHCAVCSEQWTVYSVQCAVCSVQYKVCSAQCTVYNVQCVVYNVQCTVCSVQRAVCSVQCAVRGARCAVCSVQCAVCSVQCAVCSALYCVWLHGSCGVSWRWWCSRGNWTSSWIQSFSNWSRSNGNCMAGKVQLDWFDLFYIITQWTLRQKVTALPVCLSVCLFLPVCLSVLLPGWGLGFSSSSTFCSMSPGQQLPSLCPSTETHLIVMSSPRWLSVCLSVSLPVCLSLPLSLSLYLFVWLFVCLSVCFSTYLSVSGLVACPHRGSGAPVDSGGGAEGGAGHPAFEEEEPPLASVGGASSPWRPALLTSNVASGRK